ncbi:multidrug effflux MFS transporter [Bergeriella denitrificans]|uniref:Bcr/CflA family efflux transporter n=1 Tax=Bergeriella denitrificans TaxID=494 RepID=A0A378UH84_BERDE|nr:multidrug effflux MFS transporter [Bergeriella denitrificans]STZ76500.1 integral membrane efflux protein [Bergeriella denitrificans]
MDNPETLKTAAARLPLTQKQMATLLAMLVALMPFAIDTYLPAMPEMAEDLGSNIHRIEQSLSMFMFGVAFGQLLGGPLSDIKGRKPVALAGLLVHAVSLVGLTLVTTADQLLMLRALQALGAGLTVVVVGATVRDYYDGRQAAQMFALIGIILMIVPLMAPMVGALLLSVGGWRAIFGFLLAYTLLLLVLVGRFLPKPQKADKIGADIVGVVAGRFKRVLQTRAALGYMFFQAFSFASMFAFLTESSFVYMNLYGVSSHAYAWIFALNILTMASFNRITAWRLKSGTHPQSILRWGIIVQFAANLLMVLLVSALTLPPLWALVMCVMLSVGTQGLISANTQACFMGYFKQESGSANAVSGVCQSLIGAGMGMLTTWMHNGLALVMPGMMLAATVCGIALLWGLSHQAWLENDRNKEAF